MTGYVVLAFVPVAGAVGNIAQTVAASRTEHRDRIDPGILGRLFNDRMYVFGFLAQVIGFVLAFLARGSLPLYLVQAGSCAAVGLTALLGSVLLGWRLRLGEVIALLAMAVGLLLLAGASEPSRAADLSITVVLMLVAALVLIGGCAVAAARMTGPRGAVALGGLAGLSFGVLAILSRPLAAGPLLELPLQPTFWLMVVAALLGQTLLAAAFQRGSTTGTAAAMEATAVVLAAVVGLFVLGDRVAPGRWSWVLIGLALVVGGVIALAAVVEPQQRKGPDQDGRVVTRRIRRRIGNTS